MVEHPVSKPLPADDSEGGAPAIDEPTLAQLNQLDPQGTNGIVRRVLETYQRSLDKAMGECANAAAAQDWPTIGRIAHTLRSSSASVGALVFSGHCRTVETLVREGRSHEAGPALQALQNESVRVRTALAAILADRGSPP